MALSDEVQNRYGTQYLANLTNPFSNSPTTIDTGRLGKAVDDATGEFEAAVGVTFDLTAKAHVAVACTGVVCYLLRRSGLGGAQTEKVCAEWDAGLETLAETLGSQARLAPSSSSDLTPSDEVESGGERKADFDLSTFDDVTPDVP